MVDANSGQPVGLDRRRRRLWRLLVIFLFVLVLPVGWLLTCQERYIRRFYSFAGYSNAIIYFHEHHNCLPASLTKLVTWNNAYKGRRCDLPVNPTDDLPTFLPVADPSRCQVVFVEPRQRSWWQRIDRWIIYWCPPEKDQNRLRLVWFWELDEIFANGQEARTSSVPAEK